MSLVTLSMSISLIAAVAKNGVIGSRNAIPWHIPEDMKRFRALTVGHLVLMGRKTWESLPEKFRPLPKRINIVITRQRDYPLPAEVERFATIDDAVAAHPNEQIFVIGGGEMYRQTIDRADTMYITEVDEEYEGDTTFPDIDPRIWKENWREEYPGFSFIKYERI